VEDQRKEIIFINIASTTQEVDTLLGFFSQRSGYLNEINQLNLYKNTVSQYTRENYKSFTSAALQQKAEKELFAIVQQPRQSKLIAEEKEKTELLAKQKKLAAESGIPVPPLDVPKLIVIDVNKQRMYAYENGITIFDQAVPVTTGSTGFDTVKGKFAILSKHSPFRMRSPFPGIEYDNMVDFVMFYYQGYGIHDASWRSVYGTMDYPALGSHGCVNTPYAYIQQLYQWAEIGTTVLVI
jgi:lipoprotein-anchoring transpeptidase ErfK/SrfK